MKLSFSHSPSWLRVETYATTPRPEVKKRAAAFGGTALRGRKI